MSNEFEETRQYDPAKFTPVLDQDTFLRDRYRVEEEIGRGGMGVVVKAFDQELERHVAVKVLPYVDASPDASQRLLREARAAAGLNHPNIISVYDVGEHKNVPFFVMELVPGPTLSERPPEDFESLVSYAKQICDALHHAHAQGLIHRDLKPDNVLYSADGTVKLADLGLAFPTAGSRITQVGKVVGTASYMAPEQALGKTVDGRTDLYSLGVILYELAAGELPFKGLDPLAVVSQHIHAPVVPPRALRSEIPTGLENIVLKLLAKDPEKRYQSAKEVRSALDRALEHVPPSGSSEELGTVALLEALSRGRLVGRDEELAEAREIWRRALLGQGHCLLLSGEPGAGKTRLGKELLVQAALDGATVLSGACFEFEATTPYLPFVDAFRNWVHEQRDDAKLGDVLGENASHLSKIAPELETRLGPFPAKAELPPQEERLLFFDAVAATFRSMAKRRGLVFYVDDLHWADSGTLWLLGRLLRQLREDPVMVMGSYRETELDRAHPLGKALVDWNRERLTTRIFLRRFNRKDTKTQLEVLLGETVSNDFANAVHRETEGNPFFVEEVLKSIIEQGSFRRKTDGWEKPKTLELTIPQSVMEAIGNRLDRVSTECNNTLRAAAVVGKTFTFEELLAASGGEDEDAILDALDEAVAAQVLIAERDESFAFTHDKIREVLYKELNPIRRRRLHRRTAEGLRDLKGSAKVSVEKLAYHFVEAGDYESGLDYAKQAAEEAKRVHAYEEAVSAYSRALDCAEALDNVSECRSLEEQLGTAYATIGNAPKSAEHYERALALAEEVSEQVRFQCLAASQYVTTGDERGLRLVEEALQTLDPKVDPVAAASALSTQGRFHHLQGRETEAAEILLRAWNLLELGDSPSPSERSIATGLLGYLSGAYQHLALFEESNVWAQKAVELGKKFQDPLLTAIGYEFLGENCVSTGHWKEGLEYAEAERAIATEVNSRDRYGWTTLVACLCHYMLGEGERALEEATDGMCRAEAIGEMRLGLLMSAFQAEILAFLGRFEEALPQAEKALAEAEASGILYMRGESMRILGMVHCRQGNLDKAIACFEKVIEITAGTESRISRLWQGAAHVEALIRAGRQEEAEETLQAFANLVESSQSPHFSRELERVRTLLEPAP